MLCPKCGANIPDDSKFCVFCGNKTEKTETVMINKTADQPKEILCPGCGAVMKPGAKFCTKCGMRQESPVQPMPPVPPVQPMPPVQPVPPVQLTPPVQPVPPVQPTPPVQPVPPVQPTPPVQPILQPAPQKKKGSPVGIIIAVVLALAVIAGAVYYFFLRDDNSNGKDTNPSESTTKEKEDGDESEEKDESDQSNALDESGSAEASEEAKGDVTLLDPANALADQAKAQYNNGAYLDGSIPLCADALNEYMKVGEASNLKEEAQEGIDNIYWVYVDSMIQYCNTIKNQGAYAAGLEQIYGLLKEATELTASLTEKGYTADSQEILTYNANIIQEYRDMYIKSINEIAGRENWSRDEAWNYADQAYSVKENGKPILFDEQDLEDPLRMRYVYCLAWVTRKRCETGLADNSMTYADAVSNMEAILAETDYNLLLIQDIITYGSSAQMDVEKYRNAYNAIVNQIKTGQGLTIRNDINVNSTSSVALNHFWYFNDLSGEDKYKVDTHNGTTAATREWIRNNVPGMLQ